MSHDSPIEHINKVRQLCDMQLKRVLYSKEILQLQREKFQTDIKLKYIFIEITKKKELHVNGLVHLHTMQKDQFTEERMMIVLQITEDINKLDIPSKDAEELMEKIKSLDSRIESLMKKVEELDKLIPEEESIVVYQRKKIMSQQYDGDMDGDYAE